jgi:hypothetical protein
MIMRICFGSGLEKCGCARTAVRSFAAECYKVNFRCFGIAQGDNKTAPELVHYRGRQGRGPIGRKL